MSPSRTPKDQGEPSNPNALTTGGGNTSRDYLYDIFQRLSSIEKSLTFIEASVDDSKKKVEELAKDATEAKAKYDALKPVVVWAMRGIWAIIVLIATFGLSVLGMWLKHKNGW